MTKYSQASLDSDMPDKMKADIEVYLRLTLFSDAGDKHEEVKGLYEQAKDKVREDIAEEDKEYGVLVEIHKARTQEAIDKGEDPSSVPSVWEIKAELEQKQASEVKTASLDQKSEAKTASAGQEEKAEEESFRPGM